MKRFVVSILVVMAGLGCENPASDGVEVPDASMHMPVQMHPLCAVTWRGDGRVLRERGCHLSRETTGFYRLVMSQPVDQSSVIVTVMPDSPVYPNYSFYGEMRPTVMEIQMVGQRVDYFSGNGLQYSDVLDSGGSLVVYHLE